MKRPAVQTEIQLRFTDLDPLGHVSNSVYMQYFDMGRMDFFSLISKTSDCPSNVVASIHIDMIKEIRQGDKVHVETWCSKMGNKSMTVEQHIYAGDVCATKATLILVGFDNETRSSIALPEDWQPSDCA